MKCEQSERSIHLLLDGEVRAVETADVFEHLGACDRCRSFYDQLAATNTMIARHRLEPAYEPAQQLSRSYEVRFAPRQFFQVPSVSTVALWLAIGVIIFTLLSTSVTHESQTSHIVPEYSLSPEMR